MDRKYKLFTSVMSSLLGKNGVPAPRSPSIQQLFTMGCVCVCGCFLVQVYTVGLAAILCATQLANSILFFQISFQNILSSGKPILPVCIAGLW